MIEQKTANIKRFKHAAISVQPLLEDEMAEELNKQEATFFLRYAVGYPSALDGHRRPFLSADK